MACNDEFVNLIKSAWSEDPTARPEFTTIKVYMRKLNEYASFFNLNLWLSRYALTHSSSPLQSCRSGDKGNLLDNLLKRMEQYATNLEEVVAERTDQYLVEKKKVEELLYSILPK